MSSYNDIQKEIPRQERDIKIFICEWRAKQKREDESVDEEEEQEQGSGRCVRGGESPLTKSQWVRNLHLSQNLLIMLRRVSRDKTDL